MTDKRLIEQAFPLRQASLDSVHEKNVRHGHISTLHIWPARRPLAASRAALIATLLPDPGTPEQRRRLVERIGGVVAKKVEKRKVGARTADVEREETLGGLLHWGREANPDLEWFREEIRRAYGGRAPRVLDPFAGGGSIPLEAMRLGCEATAVDINPVAWFILKCTLEYPQRLAGQHRQLPQFALESEEFMEAFFKGTARLTKKQLQRNLEAVQTRLFPPPSVDLAWHVRAWGWWVLQRASADLGRFYPVLDHTPTVAYLWARTVRCKNCRATIPLLKTRWLCKKEDKRVLLTMEPNADRSGVVFGIQKDVSLVGGNAAQRREHDRRIGQGTMTRSGAWCPSCGKAGTVAMEMEDIRQEGLAHRVGAVMTAVVVDGEKGKEYRGPAGDETEVATGLDAELDRVFAAVPFGLPSEPLPGKEALGFRVPLYGIDEWRKLFTPRQLLALGVFVTHTRAARAAMSVDGYPVDWIEAITGYLAAMLDRLANQGSSEARWNLSRETVEGTFARFALPMVWDFAEVNPLGETGGGYPSAFDWVTLVTRHLLQAVGKAPPPHVLLGSAVSEKAGTHDLIVTDPPYYDAIPYSDLMDFFYLWLRRVLSDSSPDFEKAFQSPLGPKWDDDQKDGELIDDASRHGGDAGRSKATYEEGMFRAFQACREALDGAGRLVIVFAHKDPDAWETLVSAIVRAGFVVDASWPIQTERAARARSLSSAALSSSVWLVCRKRGEMARPGWDNRVVEDMQEKINERLREYWDAGIRGPDFVWAATGPALEAYSQYPIVKKANEPGQTMAVSEFLRTVRRLVVDFVVGRILSRHGDAPAGSGLDDVTTYYLLHRQDFGLNDAPAGACILYAVSCGLSDDALVDQHELLVPSGGRAEAEAEDGEGGEERSNDAVEEEGTGRTLRLRPWAQRVRKSLGHDVEGHPAPLIDQAHRLMLLWRSGEVAKVEDYLDARGLRRSAVFHQLLQALIELAERESDERALLESLSNHIAARGALAEQVQPYLTVDSGNIGGAVRGEGEEG